MCSNPHCGPWSCPSCQQWAADSMFGDDTAIWSWSLWPWDQRWDVSTVTRYDRVMSWSFIKQCWRVTSVRPDRVWWPLCNMEALRAAVTRESKSYVPTHFMIKFRVFQYAMITNKESTSMGLTGVCYSHWGAYSLYPDRACVLAEDTECKHTHISIIKHQDFKKWPLP